MSALGWIKADDIDIKYRHYMEASAKNFALNPAQAGQLLVAAGW
jgi:hypothetical protein